MQSIETWEISGHCLEYIDEGHQYICDGICIPSITQMLKIKFGGKYAGVDKATLQRASEKGTEVHEAIERYCKTGEERPLQEVHNFKFLQEHYKFTVLDNEFPVILMDDGEPISAGRVDMLIDLDGVTGLADIKRTSTLDKEYLAYQLNLYRIACRQSYGIEAEVLKGIHLRENTRKFVDIPIREGQTWDFITEFQRREKDGHIQD
jgi:hypothetical protein